MPTDTSIIVVPTLSEDGWVFSSARMADYLMAWILGSDKSQSYVFSNDITSFGWMVAQYSQQPDLLITEVQKELTNIFSRYFNGVTVECVDRTDMVNQPSEFILGLYVEFQTNDGTVMNISQLAKISGSKFTLINDAITLGNGS